MQVTPELLEKYHLGLCTTEEQQLVLNWLEDDTSLDDITENTSAGHSKKQADINMRRFLSEKTGAAMKPVAPVHGGRIRKFRNMALQVAAAILLFTVLTGVLLNFYPSGKSGSLATLKEVNTPYGKKSKFTLPDGTLVHLNSGSTLTYPEKFTDSIRQVTLAGEAFFTIAQDSGHPFIVHSTHETQIRVLGTAFNVRAYRTEDRVEVSVAQGRVQFIKTGNHGGQVILAAGQSAHYAAYESVMEPTENQRLDPVIAWKNNELVFDGEKLGDAIKKLERWYDVKITIKNKQLPALRYTAAYHDPDLFQLLKSMGFVLGFNYKTAENGKLITLY